MKYTSVTIWTYDYSFSGRLLRDLVNKDWRFCHCGFWQEKFSVVKQIANRCLERFEFLVGYFCTTWHGIMIGRHQDVVLKMQGAVWYQKDSVGLDHVIRIWIPATEELYCRPFWRKKAMKVDGSIWKCILLFLSRLVLTQKYNISKAI